MEFSRLNFETKEFFCFGKQILNKLRSIRDFSECVTYYVVNTIMYNIIIYYTVLIMTLKSIVYAVQLLTQYVHLPTFM